MMVHTQSARAGFPWFVVVTLNLKKEEKLFSDDFFRLPIKYLKSKNLSFTNNLNSQANFSKF